MGGVNLPRGFESLPLRHFPPSQPPQNRFKTSSQVARRLVRGRRRGGRRRRRRTREGTDDGRTSGPGVPQESTLGALDRARRGAGRDDRHRHRPPEGARQRTLGRRRLPLPLRRPRDPLLAARRRRLPAAHRRELGDPARRHARDGRRLPALVLRQSVPARRAARAVRRRRPQAPAAAPHRPARHRPRGPLPQVRGPRLLRRSGPGRRPSWCCAPTTPGWPGRTSPRRNC